MNSMIQASDAKFIKLGSRGQWEAECIANGTLRLGYESVAYDLCSQRRWDEVHADLVKDGSDTGAATRHRNQIRDFFEAPMTCLWITFHGDCMYWCFAEQRVDQLHDKTKIRRTIDGWHNQDAGGKPLTKARLSGALLAVQGYRGTICSLEKDYVLHKINGTKPAEIAAAETAIHNLEQSLETLIGALHWADFEVLVDLIFRNSGWNRIGDLGKTEKDIDLALESPVTQERIAIQVKSRASMSEYEDYRRRYATMLGFNRFYFVTHAPSADLEPEVTMADNKVFSFWGPKTIAKFALRAGLTDWLLDKAG